MAHALTSFIRPTGIDPRESVVSYMPGQICCVIRLDAAESGISERSRRILHERLSAVINRVAPVLAEAEPRTGSDALDADLTPTRLRALLARDPYQPLLRSPGDAGRSGLPPWVLLPRVRSPRPSKLHCYYQVGPPGGEPADQLAFVRELVNLLNRHAGVVDDQLATAGLPVPGVRLEAATPNWLSSATPEPHTDAGPGVPPRPVPAPGPAADGWRFIFPGHPELETAETAAARHEAAILVAVLDTSPTAEDLAGAVARYPANPLLAELQGSLVIDEALSPVPPHEPPAGPAPVYPKWGVPDSAGGVDAEALRIADHGLFAAGIIRSILPNTPIRLIRVLDDLGVGSLHTLTQALIGVQGHAERGGQRLVVNLSLVTAAPTGEDFVRTWLPRTYGNVDLRAARGGDIELIRAATLTAINDLADWLADHDVLLVAAAGNDAATGAAWRPEPRLPARCDSVLGVSATRRGGLTPASYANRADLFVMGDGIATFGGNRDKDNPPAIDTAAKRVDAILGVYSAPRLPDAGGDRARMPANATGWAYWAGTSFATPVISAAAVRVWARLLAAATGPILPKPRDVIVALRALKQADLAELDAPVLAADQRH